MFSRRSSKALVFASCPSSLTAATQRRAFIKGMFGKDKKDADQKAATDNTKTNNAEADPMAGMFPPGMGALGPKLMKDFMSKPPDQQMAMMKQALEMQKKFGNSIPGLGKMNEKNAAFMEGMLKNLESKVPGASGATAAAAPTNSSASTASSSTASANPSSSSSAPNNNHNGFRGPSGPTLAELRKINLGAEIEELFAELGSMRAKRNHYRAELEKKEAQLTTVSKEADEFKAKAADLRSRLSASENTIRLMNTETMTLKSSMATLKAVQEENKRLNIKVSALQTNDTVPLKERIAALEAELDSAKDTTKALQRKLDRMRRRDLVAQFSLLLNDIRTANSHGGAAYHGQGHTQADSLNGTHASYSSSSSVHPPSENELTKHSELFAAVQEAYDSAVAGAWEGCAPSAAAALVASCESFVLNAIGRSIGKLDAHVSILANSEGGAKLLQAVAKERGYVVKSLGGGEYVVHMPADSATPALLGPFGVLAVFAQAHPTASLSVKPFISDVLAHNSKRAVVSTSMTRSGGPGGQAANTAETQVSMTFALDDERLFVSEAQDQRSQVANKGLAETRLFDEKLSLHNKKLSHLRIDLSSRSKTTATDDDAGTHAVSGDRWGDVTSPLSAAIAALPSSDAAIVECARNALTHHA